MNASDTENRTESSLDESSLADTVYWIEASMELTVLAMGLVGNILSLLVMVKHKWGGDSNTTRLILINLAISDTIMIITHLFNQKFTVDLLNTDIRAISEFGCKAFFVFYRSSKMASSWFVVGICFERFIAVTYPFKVKDIITPIRTKFYILINYTVMIAFNSVYSFTNGIKNGRCKSYLGVKKETMYQSFVMAELITYMICPIILLNIFTPFIIKCLIQHQQHQRTLTNNMSMNGRNGRPNIDLMRNTACLLTIVLAYIILLSPMAIFKQLDYWHGLDEQTSFLFKEISQRLEQLNYAINFFLYICSSMKFRHCLKELFWSKRRHGVCQESSSQSKTSFKTHYIHIWQRNIYTINK